MNFLTGDLADVDLDVVLRSDADPELRLTAFLYEQVFGHRATLIMFGAGGLTLFGRPGDRFALAIPLRWGSTIAAGPRVDGQIDLRSGSQAGKGLLRSLDDLDDVPDWAACPLAVVARARAIGHPLGGMSLLVGTALPEGAGMQADIALTSLTASVLGRLFGTELTLAERAPLGDVAAQIASRTCPDGTAALVDRWEMAADVVPFDLAAAGLRLMIIDLGQPVGSLPADVGEQALAAAHELRTRGPAGLGRLLSEATELDPAGAAVADAARAAGALGAGTLPGGCLMALVPVAAMGPVRAAVTAAWPGERVPKFLTAVSSRGGRPLRER